MKKLFYTMVSVLIVTALLLLAGCNSVANEKQIKADLEAYTKSDILAENEKITEVKIDKRQTENEEKQDFVWCTVTTEDEHYSYQKEMELTYNYYDEGGWILDDVSVGKRNEWVITPLTGISSEEFSDSLDGISVTADNETWDVTKDNIKSISIDEQKTDLEAKTDIVTATLTIDDEVEEAGGQLVVKYKFDGEWAIDSISGGENFTVTSKSEKALNATEETLLNEMYGQTFGYGTDDDDDIWDTNDLQTITINKDEISDFKLESQESYEKGTIQKYVCSCKLTKPHAELSLNAEILYYYLGSDGWSVQSVDVTAECTSINIEGKWTGTYGAIGGGGGGSAVLNVSDKDSNGTISATFKYVPDSINAYAQPGSYSLTAEIDLSTLEIHFIGGDWISNPGEKSNIWDNSDIFATLDIESSTLYGTASDSRTIKVKQ